MIQINKNEAELVRKYYPEIHIHRTVNRYYMEENPRIIRFLKNQVKTER